MPRNKGCWDSPGYELSAPETQISKTETMFRAYLWVVRSVGAWGSGVGQEAHTA